MQILKGTKDRMPDFNPYAYSKGSVYREDSLDRMAAMAKACRETLTSNDYSGADEQLTQHRKKQVENILNRYIPTLVINTPYEELVERTQDSIRWDALALTTFSLDTIKFTLFKRGMDYMIVKSTQEGKKDPFLHHTDDNFKQILEKELQRFEGLLNNSTDENLVPN